MLSPLPSLPSQPHPSGPVLPLVALPPDLPRTSGTVVWITGYSGAGKTTVARRFRSRLADMGIPVLLLDGDDLRGIFAGPPASGSDSPPSAPRWGYERTDRLAIAYGYLRLCNTLAAQGVTVVLAAVAMFEDVAAWARENVDHCLQVYLKVPEAELRARDEATKRVYAALGDLSALYDEPTAPDLVIENTGSTTPEAAADLILGTFLDSARHAHTGADKGRSRHWQSYYGNPGQLIAGPSSYARLVATELPEGSRLLEVGCGTGRDAAFFSASGHDVVAIDPSTAAIALCRTEHPAITFHEGTLPEVSARAPLPAPFDAVYSRFCLHAMTLAEELETLATIHGTLRTGGRLYIECRSINDPLARQGEVLSATERIHGHYRRFLVREELHQRLEAAGFAIVDSLESGDLAALGADNPVVLRITAAKV